MSRPFLVAVIAVLVLYGAFMTLVNLGLQRVNDHVIGKCLAPVVYVEPGTQA